MDLCAVGFAEAKKIFFKRPLTAKAKAIHFELFNHFIPLHISSFLFVSNLQLNTIH